MITVGICDDDPLVLSYLAATLARVDDAALELLQGAGGGVSRIPPAWPTAVTLAVSTWTLG